MRKDPYSVTVILNRDFGSRIRDFAETGPVWIVDSPINREAAERIWAEFPRRTHLDGVTIFKSPAADPARMLIEEMPTLDLHHGDYSADPAYTILRVVGCELKAEVREALEELGFDDFKRTAEGFEATPPLSTRPD